MRRASEHNSPRRAQASENELFVLVIHLHYNNITGRRSYRHNFAICGPNRDSEAPIFEFDPWDLELLRSSGQQKRVGKSEAEQSLWAYQMRHWQLNFACIKALRSIVGDNKRSNFRQNEMQLYCVDRASVERYTAAQTAKLQSPWRENTHCAIVNNNIARGRTNVVGLKMN
jgi:hypothetical protein